MTKTAVDYDLIVVGGGASGLMMAGRAAERGFRVLIVEKNGEVGKKLKITGGGRCNIYHAEYDFKKLLENYGDAKKYLYSPFSRFSSQDSADFFDRLGLPTVVQARNRAFPASEKATDVCKALEKYCKQNGVTIALNSPVVEVLKDGDQVVGIKTKDKKYNARYIAISTGGVASPETGSTGDGFNFLKKLGHTIHKPSPNIVPLKTNAVWIHRLSGLSLSFMKIRFIQDGKTKVTKTGKILFTHFGISGPLILNAAHEVIKLLDKGPVEASIDCFPDTTFEDLEKRILKLFSQNQTKLFKNVIHELIPKQLAAELFAKHGDIKINTISKEERKQILHTLKDLRFPITGTQGWDWAVIADGGVPMNEIDTKTMTSTKYSNLFILGDVLHVNRPSGGFSLQLCWTTAWVAAESIS